MVLLVNVRTLGPINFSSGASWEAQACTAKKCRWRHTLRGNYGRVEPFPKSRVRGDLGCDGSREYWHVDVERIGPILHSELGSRTRPRDLCDRLLREHDGRQRRVGTACRDGAYAWDILEDVAQPGRFLETFRLESWLEHLYQHERVTNADRVLQAQVDAFHLNGIPKVTHFISAEPRRD
jgi:hypothetical protein